MPGIQFIRKKIGLSYLIWLSKGNKYLLLEEPAWFVFSKIAKRCKPSGIASLCAERYGLSRAECAAFVLQIHAFVEQMNQPALVNQTMDLDSELRHYRFLPYSTHTYCLGTSLIQFCFETEDLEYYLHPLISHLKTDKTGENTCVFELFGYHGKVVFRLKGEVKGIWNQEESHLVKGMIFMHLINVMHDKTDDFWLMTVHASALSNGRKTILFPARPGSGKTTMAAMLQNRGYQIVSDDFVPIDKYEFRAWPLPLAMSVKEGSMNLLSSLYPEMKEKTVHMLTPEKSVRYISPGHGQESLHACPVKEFVFITYDPKVDFQWHPIDTARAVALLLNQSWVSPCEGTADILLNQLCQWLFYELTYSDNQKALDTIVNLFGHD